MRSTVIVWSLVVLAGLLLFATFADFHQLSSIPTEAISTPPNEVRLAAQVPSCGAGPSPSNGAKKILDPSVMLRTDTPFSGVRFENQYAYAAVLTLMAMDHGIASLFVSSGEKAEIAVPIGDYGIAIQWGSKWCSSSHGFEDSHQASVADRTNIYSGRTTEIVIEPDPGEPVRPRLVTRAPTPPVFPFVMDGHEKLLALRADARGHYHVGGYINGRSVTFLVDTGASSVTISKKFANEAGIYQCRIVGRSETANGPIDVCIATNVSIEFGPFRVTNAEVSIVPNMAADALLGMSILKSLDIRQTDGIMRIKPTS